MPMLGSLGDVVDDVPAVSHIPQKYTLEKANLWHIYLDPLTGFNICLLLKICLSTKKAENIQVWKPCHV